MFNAQDIILARQFKPDLSISKLDTESLILLKIMNHATGGGVVPVYDADIINGIASFSGVTKSKPLVSLLLNIPVTQTGSGTPSPDNIRDFIGVQGVTIGQTSGYGEYFQGLLNGTYGFVDLGTLTWRTTSSGRHNASVSNIKKVDNTVKADLICPHYKTIEGNNIAHEDKSIGMLNRMEIQINDSSLNGSDNEFFKSAMNGIYLIYELETPVTPSVTPQDFAMLCQAFGITGNTYQITFGQTVYSANLDVLTGKLILPESIKTIDENSDIQQAENGIIFLNNFFDIDEDTESINCNVYQRGENRGTVAQVNAYNPDYSFCCKLGTNADRIMIKDTRFTSVEDYKTWLSTNPVKIAVKYAEPIETRLTPTQITTLIGENVIFADVGDVTECKYTRK